MRDLVGGIFVLSTLMLTVDVAQAATTGHMFKSPTSAADTDMTGSIKKPGVKSGDVTGATKKPGTPGTDKLSKPKTVPAQ